MSLKASIVEEVALERFGELRYGRAHEAQMAPGKLTEEQDLFGEIVLVEFSRKVSSQVTSIFSLFRTLANSRDTLRPSLLSGEFRIGGMKPAVHL